MKYLILLSIAIIASCVTDTKPQDLSTIEANQLSLQTKVDSLSNLQPKVDTIVIFDSSFTSNTEILVVNDTSFFVTSDTIVVRDTLVEFVQQDVVQTNGVERFNRKDFELLDGGIYMYFQQYTYCSEDDPKLITIQLSGSSDVIFTTLSWVENLFFRLSKYLEFSNTNCSFAISTSDLDYLLTNYQYYKIIVID